MIATTIEQSKRLLEAGIDPQTADMMWRNFALTYDFGHAMEVATAEPILYAFNAKSKDAIPAWSLSALIKLIYSIPTNQHRFEYIVWDNEGNIEGIFEDCVTYLCKEK